MRQDRAWAKQAMQKIAADFNRSADTHLIRLDVVGTPDIPLYLKDESTHPTGSLKHRLARSLFLYAVCNGWVTENTPIIEASSGSTAISEAYFARLLHLPFIIGRDATVTSSVGSNVEGIGRPRVEPSFVPDVVDRMIRVPD